MIIVGLDFGGIIEISPQYCDLAVQRWEEATGQAGIKVPAAEV